MNLQQLKYVVEVEKEKSITAAAKKLYIGQPNLSKSIKELEQEIGATIFNRTGKGVELTNAGIQFLRYAKSILAQFEELESLFHPDSQNAVSFAASVPRATYIADVFSKFTDSLRAKGCVNIKYRETNSVDTITDVVVGDSSVGVVRYNQAYEEYYMNLLRDSALQFELLLNFEMQLLLSRSHPLAEAESISRSQLEPYTELLFADVQEPALPKSRLSDSAELFKPKSCINIFDRGSQFSFLQNVYGSYLWVSPMPQQELLRYDLVVKPCKDVGLSRDIIIYKNRDTLSDVQLEFIELLHTAAENIDTTERITE
ncbi:MAG: LysR family transcriptional regulator [Acutalibacteraceae bacterium]